MNEKEVRLAAERLVQFVQSIMSRFGVKEEEMTHVVRGLRSLLHGFGDISNKKGFQRKEQLEESVSYAVRLYITGVLQKKICLFDRSFFIANRYHKGASVWHNFLARKTNKDLTVL